MNNLKSSGSSLYECSISYSILKRSFAPRILITPSGKNLIMMSANLRSSRAPVHAVIALKQILHPD